MGPKRIPIAVLGLVLALGVLLLALLPRIGRRPMQGPAQAVQGRAAGPLSAAGAGPVPAAGGEDPSHLADGLNSPSGDVRSDLRIIDGVFAAYRSALRSGNPIGENSEVTAALTGRNKLGFAFMPADSAAINSKGEICDRWGTPYFFHQLSGEKMEIRSAGPDRKLWTDDDEVLTP